VEPHDLKGTHLGQTEQKTKALFEKAAGGIIFVDEAYQYMAGKDQYDKAVLDAVMTELTKEKTPCDKRILFIFAGYPDEMETWIRFNAGFARRLYKPHFTFEAPKPTALAKKLRQELSQKRYTINADSKELDFKLPSMISEAINDETRKNSGYSVAERLAREMIQLHIDEGHEHQRISLEHLCRALNEYDESKPNSEVECPKLSPLFSAQTEKEIEKSDSSYASSNGGKEKEKSPRSSSSRVFMSKPPPHDVRVRAAPKVRTDTTFTARARSLMMMVWSECIKRMTMDLLMNLVCLVGCYYVFGITSLGVQIMLWVWKWVKKLLRMLAAALRWLWNKIADCCPCKSRHNIDAEPDPVRVTSEQSTQTPVEGTSEQSTQTPVEGTSEQSTQTPVEGTSEQSTQTRVERVGIVGVRKARAPRVTHGNY
jgi:hypothetical protein